MVGHKKNDCRLDYLKEWHARWQAVRSIDRIVDELLDEAVG